jgi:hypothetical protein
MRKPNSTTSASSGLSVTQHLSHLIRPGTASHLAQLSPQHLHRLARDHKLSVVIVDSFTFFHREEIEALARERSTAHAN